MLSTQTSTYQVLTPFFAFFFFLTQYADNNFIFTLYLQEFHTSSLHITSGYEPGLPIDWNSARTHHNTTTSLRLHQPKANSLLWTPQPSKRTPTAANTAKLQNLLQSTTIHGVEPLNSFFEPLNAGASLHAKNSNRN